MKYSFREVVASLPQKKWKSESLWSRFLLRPLSFPPAWLALNMGMSANAMSWLSAFCALAGGALFGYFDGPAQWAGVALLFVFSVLDCADGNIARTLKTSNPWGSWTDAAGGYIAYTAALLSLGMAAERSAGLTGRGAGLYVFLGGFSAAANMLMRACVQSHRLTALGIAAKNADSAGFPGEKPAGATNPPAEKSGEEKTEGPGPEKWLSENLGVTGIMAPALGLGLYFRQLHWPLFFYTLLYGAGSVWVVFKLARKTGKRAILR
jgi:phosphatidylglycerophosphate synthase